MKFLGFILVTLTALCAVMVAGQNACSPWLGNCTISEDCCSNLTCSTNAAMCVPIPEIFVPGQDTGPIGPGPFPPGQ